MSHFNRLETIIICSDSQKIGMTIETVLSHCVPHILSCKLIQLETIASQHPNASVVIFWKSVTAELKLIVDFCAQKNMPLLVIVNSLTSNDINRLSDRNDFVLLPYNIDTHLIPWVKYAQHVRTLANSAQQQMKVLSHQLEERKWVDKAKGLLMKLHSIDEDSAYRALRSSAMQKSVSMSQMAKNVIHTLEQVN
jgi:response regulator NasT